MGKKPAVKTAAVSGVASGAICDIEPHGYVNIKESCGGSGHAGAAGWWLYGALVALRLLLAPLQTGYLHPDEYIQSLEPVAGRWLLVSSTSAWEFRSARPPRSWAALLATAGPPVLLLRALAAAGVGGSGRLLLAAARLWMALLSLCVDAGVAGSAPLLGRPTLPCLLSAAAGLPLLVFAVRPLSNAAEMALASLLLWAALSAAAARRDGGPPLTGCRRLAALLAVGVFVRPTFAAVAAPPVLYWLLSSRRALRELVAPVVALGSLAALCCAALVLLDSMLYGRLVVAPVNFLLYNIQPARLAQHGLHWRGTHALLHGPLLFGALWPLAGIGLLRWCRRGGAGGAQAAVAGVGGAQAAVAGAALLPLAVLSVAPHQEARFLLPLLPALALLVGPALLRCRPLWWLHVAGTAGGLLAWGFLHQGGVTPALLRVSPAAHTTLVLWQTYPAPQTLLLPRPPALRVCSVGGLTPGQLRRLLRHLQRRRGRLLLLLPAPLSPAIPGALDVRQRAPLWPHWSGEAPPRLHVAAAQCGGLGRPLCVAAGMSRQLQLLMVEVKPAAVGQQRTWRSRQRAARGDNG